MNKPLRASSSHHSGCLTNLIVRTDSLCSNRALQPTVLFCVFRHAVKRFDAQMLLDPLEEQFHLPATLVQFGNGGRRQLCIVGQKHQFLAAFQIFITDAPKRVRVFVGTVGATQLEGLIADHVGGTIHLARIDSLILGIGFGSQYTK